MKPIIGNWSYEFVEDDTHEWWVLADGRLLIAITQTETNARLIAAVPNMLKALENAGSYYQMLETATGVKHPVLQEIEAAIVQATKETK